MKKLLSVLLLSLSLLTSVFATPVAPTQTLPEYLQDISVTVMSSRGSGSGTIMLRDGVSYVWTAGHVVASERHTRTVIDASTGTTKIIVYFNDLVVLKDIIEDGKLVGTVAISAEVVKYSGPENGEDLAILKLHKKDFVRTSAKFFLDGTIIKPGTEFLHCGSFLGHFGHNSISTGVESQVGRMIGKSVFDQTSCTAFHGSSGGGVFLKSDGRYVGMLVRGAAETYNLIVPVRRMVEWAKKSGVMFALDASVPVPTVMPAIENYDEAPSLDGDSLVTEGRESSDEQNPIELLSID